VLNALPEGGEHRAAPIRAAGRWLYAARRRPRMVVRVVVVTVVVSSLAIALP